jgi:hypothetical protein
MTAFEKYKDVLLKHIEDIDDFIPYIGTFQSRLWFTKMIQQYEIFKLAMDRPGHVVELGVYHGESFFHWARLVEAYNIGERETRVIGFDSFTGFTSIHDKDKTSLNQAEKGPLSIKPGGFNAGEKAYRRISELMEIFEADHFVPQKKRLEIVKGDIVETVPEYVKRNPGLRIALLHLDCDLYEPTLVGLKHLYPLVVPGGVVILDEYGQSKFSGESAAFDEFFGARRPLLQKSHLVSNPSAWFVKDR